MRQQTISFDVLYCSQVKSDGIYLIEDTHTSYIKEYQDTQPTFIDYTKGFIDKLHEHYLNTMQMHPFAKITNGIHYYDSVVVFEKKICNQPIPITNQIKGII